jgi:hypothetical protein
VIAVMIGATGTISNPDTAPPSSSAHATLWPQIPFYKIFRFTAILDMSPKLNAIWLYVPIKQTKQKRFKILQSTQTYQQVTRKWHHGFHTVISPMFQDSQTRPITRSNRLHNFGYPP